ncbi:uncharacterized protein [Anoplolepis gracilipes]|uniref:uncharacterized protein n=1 Tax=Anoplolepis gracilipes TaxID=354296 RepID=UPI003B9EB99E
MYDKSFGLWCCALLFFASSTISLQNFTIDSEQLNISMVKNELLLYANSTEKKDNETVFNQYDFHKDFTMDFENGQDVFRINSRSNGRKDGDWIQNEFVVHYVKYHKNRNQMKKERRENFTKVDNNSHSNNENDNETDIVPYETCDNIARIRLCCSFGYRYEMFHNCTLTGESEYNFTDVYNFWSESMQTECKKDDEIIFQMIFKDACADHTETGIVFISLVENYEYNINKFIFFPNGTLYLSYFNEFVELTSYCLAFLKNPDRVYAIVCSKTISETTQDEVDYLEKVIKPLLLVLDVLYWIVHIVSMLCMLALFLVYYMLPFHNIHSFMLRRYSSMLFIHDIVNIVSKFFYLIKEKNLAYIICVAHGLINYFCSLASAFWLSAMSFDMWNTFRDFRSLTKNTDQQKRKKLLYSVFAWGGPFILVIICIIMETVPGVPKSIQPRFNPDQCWFRQGTPDQLYHYGPRIICTIISISLSIHTALKIMRYEKNTTHRLRDSESRCYNENKKWANLYLKLFIMLFVIIAIEWVLMTTWAFWLFNNYTLATFYIVFTIAALEIIKDIGAFIIFVCKKTIIQSLLKHIGQNRRYGLTIFKRRSSYSFENVHHRVKHNNFTEKYQQSETTEEEFI